MIGIILCRYRYDPEYDGGGSTPLWLRVMFLTIILFCIWWNNSRRIIAFKNKNRDNNIKSYIRLILKCLILDIKDKPLYMIGCVAIIVIYTLIMLYDWVFYAILGIAAIGFIAYMRYDAIKGRTKEKQDK